MQNLYSGKQDSSSSSEGRNEQERQNGPDGLSGPAEEAEATSSKHNFPPDSSVLRKENTMMTNEPCIMQLCKIAPLLVHFTNVSQV